MVERMKMRLTEAWLKGRAEAKLANELLPKIHGLMKKLGAGLHKQVNVGNAVFHNVII